MLRSAGSLGELLRGRVSIASPALPSVSTLSAVSAVPAIPTVPALSAVSTELRLAMRTALRAWTQWRQHDERWQQ